MKRLSLLLVALGFLACEQSHAVNNCLRAELFQKCVENIPQGDYRRVGDAVSSCDYAARAMSRRLKTEIPESCK